MVGETFVQLLEERNFPLGELRPFASETSAGLNLRCKGRDFSVQSLSSGCFKGLDIVFFSSGDDISKEWAPHAVECGAYAIDNSAAFRQAPDKLLVVPEVNGYLLSSLNGPAIIANPNCSTIQLVVALKPLALAFGLESVRVASYQAVSGAGKVAKEELRTQVQAWLADEKLPAPQAFPHSIAFNCIPQIGSIGTDGFSSEENKIIFETKKILDLPSIAVSAFTVRVPVWNSHSEAVWVTLQKDVTETELRGALLDGPGLVIQDDPSRSVYPTVREVDGQDPVYVGRIHKDRDFPKTWMLWVVADNIRKGAALNGLQIAEHIFDIPPRS
jgi:aspartate-semialdehyde dehydrogenase